MRSGIDLQVQQLLGLSIRHSADSITDSPAILSTCYGIMAYLGLGRIGAGCGGIPGTCGLQRQEQCCAQVQLLLCVQLYSTDRAAWLRLEGLRRYCSGQRSLAVDNEPSQERLLFGLPQYLYM